MPRPKGSDRKKATGPLKQLWVQVVVVLLVLIMVGVGLSVLF